MTHKIKRYGDKEKLKKKIDQKNKYELIKKKKADWSKMTDEEKNDLIKYFMEVIK